MKSPFAYVDRRYSELKNENKESKENKRKTALGSNDYCRKIPETTKVKHPNNKEGMEDEGRRDKIKDEICVDDMGGNEAEYIDKFPDTQHRTSNYIQKWDRRIFGCMGDICVKKKKKNDERENVKQFSTTPLSSINQG